MKLMTEEIKKSIAGPGETEFVDDPLVRVKYFTPWSRWTWYATEYNAETREFFGLVDGLEKEIGYFSLKEMEDLRGPGGLRIERDLYFKPRPLSEIKKQLNM